MAFFRTRYEHKYTTKNLSAYIDDELSGHDRGRVERHLRDCPSCQLELCVLRDTVSLLRSVPLRAVPRSFVLPFSVQAEQARYRRWEMGYSLLRGAAAAVSVALFLLLSSDALIGMGVFSSQTRSVEGLTQAAEPSIVVYRSPEAERAIEESAPVEQPSVAVAQGLGAGPSLTFVPAPAALAVQIEPPTVALPESALEGTAEKVIQDNARSAAPQSAPGAPQPAGETSVLATIPERAEAEPSGGGGVALQESSKAIAPSVGAEAPALGRGVEQQVPSALLTATEAPSTSTPAPSATPIETPSTATHVPSSTATAVLSTLTPIPSPTAVELAVRADPEDQAPEPTSGAFAAEPRGVLWQIWRSVRLLSGGLLGLLLILVGGLLWFGHKRRV